MEVFLRLLTCSVTVVAVSLSVPSIALADDLITSAAEVRALSPDAIQRT